MRKAGIALGRLLDTGAKSARAEWIADFAVAVRGDEEAVNEALQQFDAVLASKLSTRGVSKDKAKTKSKAGLEKTFESAVFPVSDENGYTVIGSYRYGRGLTIDPNGAWDVLHRQDPTSLLSRELVEKIIGVLIDNKPVDVFVEQIGPNGEVKQVLQSGLTGQKAVTALEEQALRELRTDHNLTDRDLLNLGIAKATGDPNVLEIGLNNFIPTKDKDALMKVPLVNAAFSLADLTQAPLGHVCACKAAEAGHILEAFGQEGFIQIDPGTISQESQASTDDLTQWLGKVTAEQVSVWRDHQNALRGEVLDRQSSNLGQVFQDVLDGRIADNVEAANRAGRRELEFNTERLKALTSGPTEGEE
jgi:hypothetical protein